MMNCSQYRSALLADPHDDHPALLEHVESCRDCARYTERLKIFEDRLGRALRVPLPAKASGDGAAVPAPAIALRSVGRRRPRRGVLAAAAAVLLALGLAGVVWLGAPERSLAADVVGHMAGEPAAWTRTDAAVPPAGLERVLAASHLALKSTAGLVSYANSCVFRGHRVPHLVVQSDAGPVTVMVLTEESLSRRVRFDEQGYRGMIVPVPGHGSIAVLERGNAIGGSTLEEVLERVRGALVWRANERPQAAGLQPRFAQQIHQPA